MKHIIFDLDSTLLNTRALKETLDSIFFKYDLDFNVSYKQIVNYSTEKHLAMLPSDKQAEARRDIDEVFKKLPKFLFNDVQNFFQDRKAFGYKCSIVTRGDIEFQKQKIVALKEYIPFDVYYVEKESKAEKILEISKPRDVVYFVDNMLEELVDVKKNFPTVITVLIKRYNEPALEKFSEADHVIISLEDLKKILV